MTTDNFDEDLAQLVQAPRYRPGPPCGADVAIKALIADKPERGEALSAAVDNTSVSASGVADLFTKYGHPIAAQAVQRHRRRGISSTGCRCPR